MEWLMTVFQFLCRNDCKKVNWAEQIAMKRRKISHELKGFKELLVNNGLETSSSPGLVPTLSL